MADAQVQRNSKKQVQILITAEDLFSRYGLKKVSVEEICRKAGASKMTFYKYFPNKSDLFRQIWNLWIEEGYDYLDEVNERDIPFPEKIRLILEYKLDFAARMNPDLIEEILHTDLDMHALTTRLMAWLLKAQARGDIRSEIRPEFLLAAFDKVYYGLTRDDELRKLYPDIAEFTKEIFNFYFYGIMGKPATEN
jgi:AcrR family transcriptional regulator